MSIQDPVATALLSCISEGVVQTDRQSLVTEINPAATRLLAVRREDVLRRPVAEVLHASEEWSERSVLDDPDPEVDARVTSHDGEVHLVRIRRLPLPDGALFVLEDRTHERKTRHRLAYTERLANGAALASLTLAPVPALLSDAPAPSGPWVEVARRIDAALRLVAEPWIEPRAADLREIVEWVTAFVPADSTGIRPEVPSGLHVALPVVLVRQVVANLVSNALRAAGPGGTVVVAARRVGEAVEIEVTDDGPGPSQPASQLFLPHFSTVPGAQGLGLTVVRDIVRAVRGDIRIEAGRVTSVLVRLPSAAPSVGS